MSPQYLNHPPPHETHQYRPELLPNESITVISSKGPSVDEAVKLFI